MGEHDWRAGIIRPEDSTFRNLDLSALDEGARAQGAPADWRRSDAELRSVAEEILQRRPDRDLWVFAYGSLMWNPGFRWDSVVRARLDGYHRRFCIELTLGRGSPDCPGLMAALAPGGHCGGVAFRLDPDGLEDEAWILLRREMIVPVYRAEFLPCETPDGVVPALTFVIDEQAAAYRPGLSEAETARMIAQGVGVLGSSREYLAQLVERLRAIGIRDPDIEQLWERARAL